MLYLELELKHVFPGRGRIQMIVDTCGVMRRWFTMGAWIRSRPISGQRGSEWQCCWTTRYRLPTTIGRFLITAS